jgi:Ca2+-binding EF-hand superfamily protein
LCKEKLKEPWYVSRVTFKFITKLKLIFELLYDVDKNGIVTADEYLNGEEKLGKQLTKEKVQEILEKFDKDGNDNGYFDFEDGLIFSC